MALLSILKYPDSRLNLVAEPVRDFDDNLNLIIKDMAFTMYNSNGLGLAATQVNIQKRIVVIDISEDQNHLMVLINPEITVFSNNKLFEREGCLSVVDVYEKVERSSNIICKFMDQNGELRNLEAEGLLSRCIQHELDHLNGKLFIDRLSSLKRDRIRTKINKLKKQT
ncbi:N-formylmethionyl-tRNA deformylase [Candidatus Kinetoplastibacterium desouzaii TCC079E]|uniref:Peptide deformylase n=1 Tax=Candidatus Kinetoplastidibacterium desouzai TCC079E TaxID=1208919 RepID=M1L366_9PROT|nr:peptide deformylase [Candidatus Kinetoplastibacterium desouzaii]AGF47193.1 N-formylmethionyl-tRNA deformylase [Candidatus Kinetoplastibacterium desouzaii TCC079E]